VPVATAVTGAERPYAGFLRAGCPDLHPFTVLLAKSDAPLAGHADGLRRSLPASLPDPRKKSLLSTPLLRRG
jgi:hypothetical protein